MNKVKKKTLKSLKIEMKNIIPPPGYLFFTNYDLVDFFNQINPKRITL